jgi:hypothetical protein
MSDDAKKTPLPAISILKCRINRDFWDAEGKRHSKGTEIEVPILAAIDGIESGALVRAKD